MAMMPVFIQNPKAASTSIRKTLPGVKTASLKRYRTVHQPLVSGHIQRQLAEATKPYVFGVVRHPFERFVSAYAYFKKPRKRTLPEFYVLEACMQGSTINDFVATVDFEKISKRVPHFRRQQWFFKSKDGEWDSVDRLLRFETLQADFDELCKTLEVPPFELPCLRATRHKTWGEVLNKAALKKLRRFYAPDFERYGYDG